MKKLTKIEIKKAGNPSGICFKSIEFQVKDLNVESRTISGIASTFGNVDNVRDRIHKGAFARSIEERGPESNANGKILLLWQHKHDDPIGKITLLEERDEGLYFEAVLDKGVENADRALIQLESGTLNQFSIGYSYVWDKMEYNQEEDVYEIFEVKLYEISPVSIACDQNTYYTGLKNNEEVESAWLELTEKAEQSLKGLSTNKRREISELLSRFQSLSFLKSDQNTKESMKKKKAVENKNNVPLADLSQIKFIK